ncbi:MAG: fluoride efflux transporter FluC [Acidiferrobacter sp.]
MTTLLFIAVFAILGAWARYGQTQLVQAIAGRDFPWATLSINVLGSLLMGLLFFLTLHAAPTNPALRSGILVGGLGAYTTFSTFSLESLALFEDGETAKGFVYMFLSLFLCVGGAAVGAWISWHL